MIFLHSSRIQEITWIKPIWFIFWEAFTLSFIPLAESTFHMTWNIEQKRTFSTHLLFASNKCWQKWNSVSLEYCFSVFFSSTVDTMTNISNGEEKNRVLFRKPIIIRSNEIMMKVTGEVFFIRLLMLFLSQSYDFSVIFFLLHHSEDENLKQRWKFLSGKTVKRQKS